MKSVNVTLRMNEFLRRKILSITIMVPPVEPLPCEPLTIDEYQ